MRGQRLIAVAPAFDSELLKTNMHHSKHTRRKHPAVHTLFDIVLQLVWVGAFVTAPIAANATGEPHQHQHADVRKVPEPFIASTAKPFAQLMDDAMAVMNYGMTAAPVSGNAEHDFVTMMIPHHQGAVDMAKALLLYTKDAELLNLAQGIITEQQNEIRLMQAWLARHRAKQANAVSPQQK